MSLLRNVLVVLRGSIIAQAIGFAALPLLARLYPPEAFGRYQVFLSVLSFGMLAVSLRYEMGILTADTDARAFSLARLCLLINGVFAFLALAACALAHLFNVQWIGRLGTTLWLLPPMLLVAGAFQTLTYLLLRSHAFHEGAKARSVQAWSSTAVALAMGWLRATGLGLVIGDLTGKSVALVQVMRQMIRKDSRYRLWSADKESPRQLLSEFRRYPLLTLPGTLVNGAVGLMLPMLMFGIFGASISGQYALVERCASVPVAVISQAVAQVYMASFSTALRTDPAESLHIFSKVIWAHFRLALLPTLGVILFGPRIFEFVFGARWALGGRFLQSLAPMLFVSFLVAPIDNTLQMLNQQTLNFTWHVFRFALILAAWFVIWRAGIAPLPAIRIHSAVTTVAYGALLFTIYRSVAANCRMQARREI